MQSISQIPLVRIFIPFLTGIISAASFNLQLPGKTLFLLFLLLIIIFRLSKRHFEVDYDKRWLFGLLIYMFLFSAGNLLTNNHNELNSPNHFSHHSSDNGYVVIDIIEPVSERRNTYRAVCRVNMILLDTTARKVNGKVMLYFEKDSLSSTLKYGDRILTNNDFYPVRPPQNPNQFNYKQYLAYSNIHFQGYMASGGYQIIGSGKGSILKTKALLLRENAMQTLHSHNVRDREFAVISALLLGYREYIDDDLQREFAGAGAMHILCVSGLHVGIIFLVLNSLFSFLNKIKKGKIIKAVIIIILIWFYATLTGYSPSVLRASTMFSFVAVARSLNRYTNIYNILAASAILLTIIDPYIITKIGFQLSYLAVISIVTLQPYFYRLIYTNNKLTDKVWAITTVSIAAQIGTGPLAIHYFNQFPNYFIITNLIVIPLASIVIYSSLIFLIFAPVNFLAGLFSKALSFFVYLMHKSVHIIESLPYSTLQNVYLSLEETLLIFLLIILLTGFFVFKARICLKLTMPTMIILIALFCIKTITTKKQNALVVYSINNNTAIDFISGKESTFLLCENMATHGSSNIDFNIAQNRIKNGITSVDQITLKNDTSGISNEYLWTNNEYFYFNNLRIKILTNLGPTYKNNCGNIDKLKLDYLIVSQNPWLDIADLKEIYDFKKIIFDSSNPFWKINKWLEECDTLRINSWSTRHHGAYIKNL